MYGDIIGKLQYKPEQITNTALSITGLTASLVINPPQIPFPVLTDYEYCTVLLESFETDITTIYEVKYEIHYKWNELLYKIGEVTSVNGKAEFPNLIKGLSYHITAIPLDGKYLSKKAIVTLNEYDIRQEPIAITTYEQKDYINYDHYLIMRNIFGVPTVYLDGEPDYISLDKADKNLRIHLNKDATERATEFDLVIEDYRIEDIVISRKKILVNDGFSIPYNISIEFTDTNAAIFRWNTDGQSFINKVYISDNIINKGTSVDVIGTSTYIISNYDNNKTQYLWLSSLREGKEKFSDPITIDAFDKSLNPLIGPSVNYSINQNNDLLVYLNHNSTTVDNYSVYLGENEITSIDGLTPIATSASKNIVVPNFDVYNNYDRTLKLLATTNKYNHSYLSENKDLYLAYDWTPTNLTKPSEIWVNAENIIKDSSNRVDTLINVSDPSFSFTQTSDTNKPILYNDTGLGHNVIRFDGIDDFFQNISSRSGELFKNVRSGWCFSVVKRRGVVTSGGLFYAPNGTDASSRFNVGFTGDTMQLSTRRIDSSGTDTLTSSINNFTYQMVLLASDFENGKKTIYINGLLNVQKTIDSGLTSNTNGINNSLRIGVAAVTEVGLPIDADLAELIIGSNSLPTASEIDGLFGWAAHKYGLIDNLPFDHPYKNRKPVIDHTPTNLTATFKND